MFNAGLSFMKNKTHASRNELEAINAFGTMATAFALDTQNLIAYFAICEEHEKEDVRQAIKDRLFG